MSKISFSKSYSFVGFITITLILLIGCQPADDNNGYYELKIEPERLHQIETLDLNEMQCKTKTHADTNEPPPDRTDTNEPPPDRTDITIEQCRALAMENNLDIKVQLIEPSIAAEKISEQEARFEAAFVSHVRYSKTDSPTASALTSSKAEFSDVGLGVEVPLQTGGNINFDLARARLKSNNLFSTLNPSYKTDFSISISQPLLKNAGKRVNTYAIRIAGYEKQIVDTQTKLELIRVIADADRLYWLLYAAGKELEVRKQEYDLAMAQLDQARRFVESGERALIEVVRAEAGVAERIEAIIIAENNLRDSQRKLKKLLNKPGMEMQTPTVLIPATEPDPVHYELEKELLVEKAIENRMEMLELELQIAADVSTVDFLQNQMLPLVTLDYRYNINGLGATSSDSFDMLTDKRFEDHHFGINLLVPLGNQAAKSRLLQALYQRRQRLATKQNRQTAIELEVLNAIDQLEANWQRILANRQNAILAGRLFEAEKRQFELGFRTSTDVLNAQTTFADAQSSEISALAGYQIALVDIAYATGTLLGAAKVQWQPIIPQNNIRR